MAVPDCRYCDNKIARCGINTIFVCEECRDNPLRPGLLKAARVLRDAAAKFGTGDEYDYSGVLNAHTDELEAMAKAGGE